MYTSGTTVFTQAEIVLMASIAAFHSFLQLDFDIPIFRKIIC